MVLPPRTLAIRLFFWTALLAYSVWILREKSPSDVFVTEPAPVVDPRVPLPRPEGQAAVGGAPAGLTEIVDIEAAVTTMNTAEAALRVCEVVGTFSVRLDQGGISEAWILPNEQHPLSPAIIDCAAQAAWGLRWPPAPQDFAMERALMTHAAASGSGAAPSGAAPSGSVK